MIADVHIHSPYSRATSPLMSLENLYRGAQIKGISVVGTGDFTHPAWFREIQEKLEPAEPGVFVLKKQYRHDKAVFSSCRQDVRFMLSGEISCIYSKNGKVRKVHVLILMPDWKSAQEIIFQLAKIGNLASDGRPILGLDAKKLLHICINASPDVCVIPAHIWTPYFSVLGSQSGFDSLEECFEELTPHIFALETGLSSDPAMNWRLSELDRYTLVSNSDAHSLDKLGREANVFDAGVSYHEILRALKTKEKFLGTIEFFPEEGKYHLDGHRACTMRMTPQETRKYNFKCPQCGKKVTKGVMHRVEELADRPEGFKPGSAPSFKSVIPLKEILAAYFDVGANSKKVAEEYDKLISELGNEFDILLNIPIEEIGRASTPHFAGNIKGMRNGAVHIKAGYDGVYGEITIKQGNSLKKGKGTVSFGDSPRLLGN